MTYIKEVPGWFLRHGSVPSGKDRDRETTFSKIYPNGHDLEGEYNVFLENDYPSEKVYSKLFNSVPFIIDPYGTAFEKQQGLVQKATDANVINRSSLDNGDGDGNGGGGLSVDTETTVDADKFLSSNNFTTVVLPHQLGNIHLIDDDPDGVETTITTENYNGLVLVAKNIALSGDHSDKTRKNFQLKAAVDDTSIEINSSEVLAAKGITQSIPFVSSIAVDGSGAVTNTTTGTLNFTKGVLTSVT